jgi:hypothetical protein
MFTSPFFYDLVLGLYIIANEEDMRVFIWFANKVDAANLEGHILLFSDLTAKKTAICLAMSGHAETVIWSNMAARETSCH